MVATFLVLKTHRGWKSVSVIIFVTGSPSIESKHGCDRSGNGQGKNSSRSGKCQRISFWVRENWNFEEKLGKIEIILI